MPFSQGQGHHFISPTSNLRTGALTAAPKSPYPGGHLLPAPPQPLWPSPGHSSWRKQPLVVEGMGPLFKPSCWFCWFSWFELFNRFVNHFVAPKCNPWPFVNRRFCVTASLFVLEIWSVPTRRRGESARLVQIFQRNPKSRYLLPKSLISQSCTAKNKPSIKPGFTIWSNRC